jgi:hypothetical protein
MLATMAKPINKKPNPDRHKSKRRVIAIPDEWGLVAERLAESNQRSLSGLVCHLINEMAKDQGLGDLPELPAEPWEFSKRRKD